MKYRLLYFIFLFYNSPIFGLLHRSFFGSGLRIGQKQEHFTFLVFGGFILWFLVDLFVSSRLFFGCTQIIM